MPYRDFIRTRIKKSHRKLSYNKEKIAMMRAFQSKSLRKSHQLGPGERISVPSAYEVADWGWGNSGSAGPAVSGQEKGCAFICHGLLNTIIFTCAMI